MSGEDRATSASLLAAWQAILPARVEVACGSFFATAPKLSEAEAASAGTVDALRSLELRSGRSYAKVALGKLGVAGRDLLIGPNRAPLWPIGVRGSLTHARFGRASHVAAVVAWERDIAAIGIDVEVASRTPRDLWPQFLSTDELASLKNTPEDAQRAHSVWCAKESALKAIGKAVDPRAIRVELDGPRFTAYWQSQDSRVDGAEGTVYSGMTQSAEGWVIAVAWLTGLEPRNDRGGRDED